MITSKVFSAGNPLDNIISSSRASGPMPSVYSVVITSSVM